MLRIPITVFFLVQNCISYAQEDTSKLTVNQQAPPLKVAAWIKGEPVNSFEKGHVYIIELGFISCAPCRAAMPHFTELAKKYRDKASLISIFVYENDKNVPDKSYIKKVENFVDKMGDKMGYAVAVDDEKQTTASTWYEPASRAQTLGFPAIFVIDQNGIIVRIGTPEKLDEIVQKVIDKSYDPEDGKVLQAKNIEINKRIAHARKNMNFDEAILLADSLIANSPGNTLLYKLKFEILLDADIMRALAYGRSLLLGQCKDDEPSLKYMAQAIMGKSYIEKYRNSQELNDLAIQLTERALSLCNFDKVCFTILRTQAMAYCFKGDFVRSVEKQELAIKRFENIIQKNPEQAQKTKENMVRTLGKYQKAVETGVMKW